MCEILDVQVSGQQPDATGQPTALRVSVRVVDCLLLDIEVRQGSTVAPLFAASNVAVVPDPQLAQGLAEHTFVNTPSASIRCGDLLTVQATCSTDNRCGKTLNVPVTCKDFVGPNCPSQGPALAIQPPINQLADCVASGTYTVTIGGTWPEGTEFAWSIGNFPGGMTSSTGITTNTYDYDHTAGSTGKILIAEVTVPGCEDVESVVLFPPAGIGACPDSVSLDVTGPGVTVTTAWNVGDDVVVLHDLPPGDLTVHINDPTGNATYTWFRDNMFVFSSPPPGDLLLSNLAPGSVTPVAALIEVPCCASMLPQLSIGIKSETSDPGEPDVNDPGAPDNPVEDPIEPPSISCAALYLLVGVGLIIALVGLVVLACIIPFGGGVTTFVTGMAVAVGLAVLLLLICGPNMCRIIGCLVWALKWSIAIGLLVVLAFLSLSGLLTVIIMGMTIAGLIWWLVNEGCPVPQMQSLP